MKTYKPTKKNFIMCIAIYILAIVILFIFSNHFSTLFLKYGMPSIALCFFLYNSYLQYLDYNSVAQINHKACTLSIMGKQHRIEFEDIIFIKYRDYKHLNFGKCIVLQTKNNSRVVISCEYYNYINFWRQVVDNARESNPNIIIDPKVMKRLNR